jgi:amidohydrolase
LGWRERPLSRREDAAALLEDMIALRHAVHSEPEIGLSLPRTQEKVLAALDGLPLEISTGKQLTSVTAVLRGARPGPAVLLRGDMDALPLQEDSELPFRSTVDGCMHACGHDMHTAMLAAAARLLCAHRAELAGDVVFMFQPGEEGHDGAKLMLDEGVLDAAGTRPVAAYALHVVSNRLPRGVFGTKGGPILASSNNLRVTVRGSGGHGSAPQMAKDPVPAACEMVLALQAFVTRSFDVFDPVVLTVGSLHAGTKENIIPDTARFDATVRCFSSESLARMRDGVLAVCRGIGDAHGLGVDAEFEEMYPVTVNAAAEAGFVAETVAETCGEHCFRELPHPQAAAEDFSRIIEAVPGAMVMLGACPPDRDYTSAPNNHSPRALFDDAVLPEGAALLAELAIRRLSGASQS